MSQNLLQANASYAAYYNVARHNVLLALNNIAAKAGIGTISNDQDLPSHPVLLKLKEWGKIQDNDESVSDKDIRVLRQVIAGIQKAFPILGGDFVQKITGQLINQDFKAESKSPKERYRNKAPANASTVTVRTWRAYDMHKVLQGLIAALMEYRNFFSHAYQNPITHERQGMLPALLGLWFDAARRGAKDRFEFLESDVVHLLRHSEITKKEDLTLPHALLVPCERTFQLSPRGSAFFCCLFLDKQQGVEFLKQIRGFKYDAGRPYQATLRTYTHWSIRLPFVRIETSSDTQSLALDVFNELARCPAEVFEQLSPAEREPLVVQPDAEWQSDTSEDGEGVTTHFIRHTDRFASLAMACLDHMAYTNDQYDTGIRFMLDMGDFYHRVYPKKLPDGSVDIRRIKQKVLRYGLLPHALEQQQSKPTAWSELERESTERDYPKPYIVKTRPHYHLAEQGSIPIKLQKNCVPSLYQAPEPDPDRPNNYLCVEVNPPDFWLSPHELSSLAFYQHLRLRHALHRNDYPVIGDLFNAYQVSLERLYKDIQQQPHSWLCSTQEQLAEKLQQFGSSKYYTLLPQDLPSDLLALLLQKKPNPKLRLQEQAKNTLKLLLQDGEHRQDTIEAAKETIADRIKPGKHSHRALRAGEMATFVAKDILRMQPVQDDSSEHKGKPTSILADLLQARLAYFGREKNSLPALFESLRLTGNTDPDKNHPFLADIDLNAPRMNGIAQFYEAYLQQRQRFLKNCIQQLDKGQITLQSPHLAWLNMAQMPERLERSDDLPRLLAHYLAPKREPTALNLPRGLFRQLIVKALHNLGIAGLSTDLRKEETTSQHNGRHLSLSTIVRLYFEHVSKDASQNFYYPENPVLNEKIQKNEAKLCEPNADIAKLKQIRKQYEQQKYNFFRTCARYETQDQVLFLMTKWLIDIQRNATKKGASTSTQHGTTMFDRIKLQTLSREDLNDMVAHHIKVGEKTIYVDEIKAKNIGKFKALGRDRRLPGILHYYPAEQIHFSMVQHELQAYPRAQNDAFEHVLAFESLHNKKTKTQAGQASPSLHGQLLEQALKKNHLPRAEQEQLQAELLTLRNAFCHNEVPTPHSGSHTAQAKDMLEHAQQQLSPARQQGNSIDPIKGDQQVAKYFARTLQERYQRLANRKERTHD